MKKDEENANKKKDGIVVETTEKIVEENTWADGIVLAIHILLPLVIAGLIWGRKTILSKIISHLDRSCISVFCPSFSKRERLLKWATAHLPYMEGGLGSMWRDGSQLCTLINSAIPGACPNPHRHWKKAPSHGQALAYKYLGIVPVFTEEDFKERNLTSSVEKNLIEYISSLQQAISKITPNEESSYSNDFIARGMGLVTGEQHRKTIFYVYPNTKTIERLFINIRGPYNTYGSATLNDPDLKKDDTSFFSKLLPKNKIPVCDIKLQIFQEKDRAKVTFIPCHSGVYEVCLTTHGEHITGSPFNINIEKNRTGKIDSLTNEETIYIIKERGVINEENNNESDGSYDYEGEICCIKADSEIEEEIVRLLGDQDLVCPKPIIDEKSINIVQAVIEIEDAVPRKQVIDEILEVNVEKVEIETKNIEVVKDEHDFIENNSPRIEEEVKHKNVLEDDISNKLEEITKPKSEINSIIEEVKEEEIGISAFDSSTDILNIEINPVDKEEESSEMREIVCDKMPIPKESTFPKMKLQELRIQEILKNNTKVYFNGKDATSTATFNKNHSQSLDEENIDVPESGMGIQEILREALEDNKDVAVCLNVSIEEIECVNVEEKVVKEASSSDRGRKRVQRQKVVDNTNSFGGKESSLKLRIKEFENKSNGIEKLELFGFETRKSSLGLEKTCVSKVESVGGSTKQIKLGNEVTPSIFKKYDTNINVFSEVEKGKNNAYVPEYPRYLKRGMSLSAVEDRLGKSDYKTRRTRFLGGSLEIFTKEENNNILQVNRNLSSSVEADLCYLLLKENLEKISSSSKSLSNYNPDLLVGHTNSEKKPHTSSLLKNSEKEVRSSKASNISTGNVKKANLPNLVVETAHSIDALDFREQFHRRREYWDKLSSINSLNSSFTSLAEPETTWKPKSERNLTLNQSLASADYGSVDELNIPSVKERKRMFLNEPRVKEVGKVFESIHERIKIFDNGSEVRNVERVDVPKYKENDFVFRDSKVKKVKHIPDNGTIKAKLKERFEKAQRFFKKLEKK